MIDVFRLSCLPIAYFFLTAHCLMITGDFKNKKKTTVILCVLFFLLYLVLSGISSMVLFGSIGVVLTYAWIAVCGAIIVCNTALFDLKKANMTVCKVVALFEGILSLSANALIPGLLRYLEDIYKVEAMYVYTVPIAVMLASTVMYFVGKSNCEKHSNCDAVLWIIGIVISEHISICFLDWNPKVLFDPVMIGFSLLISLWISIFFVIGSKRRCYSKYSAFICGREHRTP
jgi:hypothetical protein